MLNPSTCKAVKIGSQTYNRLVRAKMIDGTVVNRSKKPGRCIVSVHGSRIEAYKAKEDLQQTKPPSEGKVYALAPDGKSIVLKNKRMKSPMITKLMELAHDNVEKKILELLERSKDGDIPLAQFRKLIFQELITIPENQVSNAQVTKKKLNQTIVYNNATDTSTKTSRVSSYESGSDEEIDESDTDTVASNASNASNTSNTSNATYTTWSTDYSTEAT